MLCVFHVRTSAGGDGVRMIKDRSSGEGGASVVSVTDGQSLKCLAKNPRESYKQLTSRDSVEGRLEGMAASRLLNSRRTKRNA